MKDLEVENFKLRTLRNLHVKYLKMIRYKIDHRNKNDYDGYYSDKCLEEIIELLDKHDNQVSITI
jgi:hypothetical protein